MPPLTRQQTALVRKLELSKNPKDRRLAQQLTGSSVMSRRAGVAEAKRRRLLK